MHYAYQKQYVTDIPIIFFCLPENKPCFTFFVCKPQLFV